MGYHPTHGPWVTNYLQLRVKWAAGLKLEFSPGLVSRLHHLLVGPQDVTSLPLNLSLSYNSKHWWCFFPLAYMLIFWAGYFPYGCGKSFPLESQSFLRPKVLCLDGSLFSRWHQTGASSPWGRTVVPHPSQLASWEEQPCMVLRRPSKRSGELN